MNPSVIKYISTYLNSGRQQVRRLGQVVRGRVGKWGWLAAPGRHPALHRAVDRSIVSTGSSRPSVADTRGLGDEGLGGVLLSLGVSNI